MRLLLAGGRILDPACGRDSRGDLVIENGRVASVTPPGEGGPADKTVDCTGRIVAPGFVDLHVHLREPPEAATDPSALPETVATGSAAAVAGGFTTVCAMPNTTPPLDSPEAVRWYLERGREANLARVLPVGAMTRGRAGGEPADLAAMRDAGAVAFSDDGCDIADDAVFEAVLRRAAVLGVPVICHCENAELAGDGVIFDGPLATALGLPGIPAGAEESAVDRACAMAARTACRVHIAHVSTEGSVETIRRAKAAGHPVTAEATPHHLSLTYDELRSRDAVYKVNPPLASGHDVDAVVKGIRDGTIDALATDHAPHTAEAKARGLAAAPFGMIGLESALAVYVKVLVEGRVASWPGLIERLTAGPARVLGLPVGTLAPGSAADVAVLDPEARWTINPDRFASRARNCPFTGWDVQARCVLTLVGGRVVYRLDT